MWRVFLCLVVLASSPAMTSFDLRRELLNEYFQQMEPRSYPEIFIDMTTTEIIEYWGYTTETHYVTTEDGYILELHRIPHGINDTAGGIRPVAFLQHCLLCSSSDWVMDKPHRALAYLLADSGYDVWMTNVRGNTYSRNHTSLDPENRQFWQFTWGDMALYDIPASIDYVLSSTGEQQVYYMGFSMGTTAFFAMMSEKNEYTAKIKCAALMAPAVYMEHVKGPLKLLGNYSDDLDFVLSLLGYNEFLPSNDLMDKLAEDYCDPDNATTAALCQNILFLIAGPDPDQLNPEYVPVYVSHTPAGTSTHTINHYGQLIAAKVFQMYDWGPIGNNGHYGQPDPPLYDLTVPTPPLALYWGQNDWLATPTDVARLTTELTNLIINHRVDWDMWNHLDFVWGINAKELVYDHVMNFISQY